MNTFTAEVLESDTPVLVDFTGRVVRARAASMHPILDEIAGRAATT